MNLQRDIVSQHYRGIAFEEVFTRLLTEIGMRNYRVTRIDNIDNIHERREQLGLQFDLRFQHYKIVTFCNLDHCAQLISAELLAGVFMPARFVVFQQTGQDTVSIAFLKPTAFARLFHNAALTHFATQLEDDIHAILNEVE